MESPFYPKGNHSATSVFTIYLEPILDSYSQTYINVITLSGIPDGPLGQMVKMISLSKLSPFMDMPSNTTFRNSIGFGCTYVLLKYPKQNIGTTIKNANIYMTVDDIPALFSYLKMNQYHIDTDLTKMMNKSRVQMGGVSETRYSGDRKMICMGSYITAYP
jgi:hypothetical protein